MWVHRKASEPTRLYQAEQTFPKHSTKKGTSNGSSPATISRQISENTSAWMLVALSVNSKLPSVAIAYSTHYWQTWCWWLEVRRFYQSPSYVKRACGRSITCHLQQVSPTVNISGCDASFPRRTPAVRAFRASC